MQNQPYSFEAKMTFDHRSRITAVRFLYRPTKLLQNLFSENKLNLYGGKECCDCLYKFVLVCLFVVGL